MVWVKTQRKLSRVGVYHRSSLSSQQEFFPCFITAHSPVRICLKREAESPPDVISSTFTYNHTEKQHSLTCDDAFTLLYLVYLQYSCIMLSYLPASNMPSVTTELTDTDAQLPNILLATAEKCHCVEGLLSLQTRLMTSGAGHRLNVLYVPRGLCTFSISV